MEYDNSVAVATEANPLESSYHVWAMDPSDAVLDFLQTSRGYSWDKKRGEYVMIDPHGEPAFNQTGLAELYRAINSVINKNNVSGDLSKEEINVVMLDTMTTIVTMMTMNKKRWELKDYNRDGVRVDIENRLNIFLSRIKDGEDRRTHFGQGGAQETFHNTNDFDQANNSGGLR